MAAVLTLVIDIGASQVKVHLVDQRGRPIIPLIDIDTPSALTPSRLIALVEQIALALPPANRVSIGIPGIVKHGVTYAVPVLGDRRFHRYPLASKLEQRLARPVRIMNDGELHGLGVIHRKGVELVLTLGTGLGTALYLDGQLGPRIQFISAWHPRQPIGGAYGDAARRTLGERTWSRRVHDAIDSLRRITNFDRCYLGGGNAHRVRGRLPRGVVRVDNVAAGLGGVRLWDWAVNA